MSVNATPDQIVTRLVALGPLIPDVVSAFADVNDAPIAQADVPALGVIVGRVLEVQGLSLTSFALTQEYILFLHAVWLGKDRPLVTEAQHTAALAFLLPLIQCFSARPRLQLEDGGIVFRAELSPDGVPRRSVHDKVHTLGLVGRLRVTTHHMR